MRWKKWEEGKPQPGQTFLALWTWPPGRAPETSVSLLVCRRCTPEEIKEHDLDCEEQEDCVNVIAHPFGPERFDPAHRPHFWTGFAWPEDIAREQ